MSDTNSIPSFGAMLRQALGDAIVAEAGDNFLEMCAENILFQMPFAPEGAVAELKGRDALVAYLPLAGGLIDFESMSEAKVSPAADGKTFTLEFKCKAASAETGARYDQDFVSVVQVQDGLITHYRDYWNPTTLLNCVGGSDKLKSTFAEFLNV